MALAIYSTLLFVSLGFIANKLRLLGNKHSGILLGFLLNFALPALIFNGTYHAEIDFVLIGAIGCGIISSFIGGGIVFAICKILKIDRYTMIPMVFLGTLGNTLFIGIPLINGALGEEYANKAIIYDQLAVAMPLAVISPLILTLSENKPFKVIYILKRFTKNPLFLAMLSAFLLKIFPIEIPEYIFHPVKQLASTATPIALFAIGVQMNFSYIKSEWKNLSIVLSTKMMIAPAILMAIVKIFNIEIDDDWSMAILQCSMPPLVSAAAIIIKANLNGKLAISSVTIGILMSGLVATFWLNII